MEEMKVDVRRLRALASGGQERKRTKVQSIRSQIQDSETERAKNMELLYACEHDWSQLEGKRREHERFMRYMSGDQWSDLVPDPDDKDGNMVQEKVLISRTGITPITINVMQEFLRNVLGQMLSNKYQSVVKARRSEDDAVAEMLTNTLQACLDLNENPTLDINHLFCLVSVGISWGKVTYAPWDERNDTDGKIFFVNQNRIGWNQDCEDPRLFDLRRIFELHDYSPGELLAAFAKTPDDERALRELYRSVFQRGGMAETTNENAETALPTLDFWQNTSGLNKCRVIEVWQKLGRWVLWVHDRATSDLPKEYLDRFDEVVQAAEMENARRREQALQAGIDEENIEDARVEYERRYEQYWHVKYLTPQGVCLLEMETPYKHQQHPYVFAAMPIVDGVAKPLLSDLVDMQRNINRQRTMLDAIIAGSAKNTLFIAEEQIPSGMQIEDYAEQIERINGVVKYKAKAGVPLPEYLSRNSTNIGVWEVLNFDMQQAKEVAGLSGALQGQAAKSGTPSSLYAQQAQNAMLNFVLLFDRFNEFCRKRDDKLLKVLIQYYDKRRHLAVSGQSYNEAAAEYIPEKAQAIADNYALVIAQAADAPVFRQRIDDYLMEFVKMGLPFDLFLENTTLPFGKRLAAQIKSLQQQQQQQQQLDPELMAQVQAEAARNADPRGTELMGRMFGGANPAVIKRQEPILR